MLASVVKFADDAQALEKTLRLLQSSCTIAIGLLAGSAESAPFLQARKQFALGRRYFRLLKWYPCWTAAYAAFNGGQDGRPLETLLAVTEKTFLGMYFFLEMFTITNAIGITTYDWGPHVQMEADKSWAYAIIASILIGLCKLFLSSSSAAAVVAKPPVENEPDVKGEKDAKPIDEKEAVEPQTQTKQQQADVTSQIYRQIVIDCCDIFIPGASLGWFPVSSTVVGTAQFISTVVAGQLIWNRVQSTK